LKSTQDSCWSGRAARRLTFAPVPTPCGTTHRLCCLRLLAPASLWNTAHPLLSLVDRTAVKDPLFDRDQTQIIPGLCGLISALVCGMCGREKVKSDHLPSCPGSLNQGRSSEMRYPSTPLYGPPLHLPQ